MKLRLLLLISLIGCTGVFGATLAEIPACQTGTLASYVSTYGSSNQGSCSIGALSFTNFYFQSLKVVTDGVASTRITSADLILTPDAATNSFFIGVNNLDLLNPVNLLVAERYLIAWYADPPPIIAGDELRLDPPSGPVTATKFGCIDSTFTNTGSVENVLLNKTTQDYSSSTFDCAGPAIGYMLKTDGIVGNDINLNASIDFDNPAYALDIRLVIDFAPGTVTGFEGIELDTTTVPEPGANLMIAGGLLALGWIGKRKAAK